MDELERRRAPRSPVELDCTLTRRIGSPIMATTVDLGSGGMSVAATRPLAVDEELNFDLPPLPFPLLSGRARVLRDQGHCVYGLRFEPSRRSVLGRHDDPQHQVGEDLRPRQEHREHEEHAHQRRREVEAARDRDAHAADDPASRGSDERVRGHAPNATGQAPGTGAPAGRPRRWYAS
jgi:hypothetical protein